MNNDLGVALRAEPVTERDEFVTQLKVVENLAVEYDPGRIAFVRQGLLTSREIDDGQTSVTEPDT